MNYKSRLVLTCIFAILLAVLSIRYFSLDQPISVIGKWRIYQKDINYRDQIIRLDFPEEKRSLGRLQLEKAAVLLAILHRNKIEITESEIAEEEARIDSNTKNPEQLQKIKGVFGSDHGAYLQDFVLPVLVERKIYNDFFISDPSIHAESLKKATDLIEQSQNQGDIFRKVVNNKKLKLVELVVSMKEGLTWRDPHQQKEQVKENTLPMKVKIADQKNKELHDKIQAEMNKLSGAGNNQDAQIWYDNIITFLKPGEISKIPLSREDAWLVAHYVKPLAENSYLLEVVGFEKINFSDWLEAEKKKL